MGWIKIIRKNQNHLCLKLRLQDTQCKLTQTPVRLTTLRQDMRCRYDVKDTFPAKCVCVYCYKWAEVECSDNAEQFCQQNT